MNVTQEMTDALKTLRHTYPENPNWVEAFKTLDKAGVFAAIDEHTGHGIETEELYDGKAHGHGVVYG